jgi:glycosyltransferase involved in cell wall biosynthesis
MKFSCYKGSKIATLPVFLKQIREKSRGPQVSSLVRYICVSEPIFSAYLKSGIPPDKVSVVPNFVVSHEISNSQIAFRAAATNWVVVGRLVEEKGFGKLIENWPDEFNLDIIGEGPDRSKLEALSLGRSNIRMLGALSKSEVSEALPTYSGAFVPSIWSEGSPLTEIEFYRAGLPVIQIERPGRQFYEVSELTIPYEDFMTVQARPLLINAMNYVLANHSKLSNQSKQKFEAEFSSEAWLKRINGCLQDWFGFRVD